MHACKVVFVIYQFMGCLSILLWPKLFPSMAYDGFQIVYTGKLDDSVFKEASD